MPSFAAQRLIQQCKDFTADLNSHYLVATFNEKTDAMSELSKNRNILEQQVFPAFEQLSNTIAGLQNSGYNDAGLCHFPEGNTYYEYLVRCYTGSDDSVATLEKRTASQRKKDLLLVSKLLEDHPDLTDEPERLDFSAQSPEEMLATLQQAITADFPSLPDCNVTVKYINAAMEDYLSPAFYLTSPLDQLTENTIYINQMVMKESGCSRHWRMKVFRDICIKTSTSTARMCRPSGHCLAIPATQKAGRHSWNYIPIFTADCPKMLQNSALQIRLQS